MSKRTPYIASLVNVHFHRPLNLRYIFAKSTHQLPTRNYILPRARLAKNAFSRYVHITREKKIWKSELDTTFWIFPYSQDIRLYIPCKCKDRQEKYIARYACIYLGRISCHDFPLPPPIKQPLHSHSSSGFLRARVFIICQWHATIFSNGSTLHEKAMISKISMIFLLQIQFYTQNTGTIVKYIAL